VRLIGEKWGKDPFAIKPACGIINIPIGFVTSGPIAQRLEQGTHNPLVGGSNPSGPKGLAAKLDYGDSSYPDASFSDFYHGDGASKTIVSVSWFGLQGALNSEDTLPLL
jgi:hypothetical protein